MSAPRSLGCIYLKSPDKVTGESTGRSGDSLKGVIRAAFLEDGKGASMIDGDVMHIRVVAAREMQPLVVSSAVAAHLGQHPAHSGRSSQHYLDRDQTERTVGCIPKWSSGLTAYPSQALHVGRSRNVAHPGIEGACKERGAHH